MNRVRRELAEGSDRQRESSGTTQMGHMVAERLGMSLLTRCSGKHFLLLIGKERLLFEPHLDDSVLKIA